MITSPVDACNVILRTEYQLHPRVSARNNHELNPGLEHDTCIHHFSPTAGILRH